MRQPVQAFAIGLFAAGIIMLIGIFYFDDSVNTADDLSIDELTSSIEEEGYRVVTEEEYIAIAVNKDKTKNRHPDQNKTDEQDIDMDDDSDKDKEKKDSTKNDDKEKATDKVKQKDKVKTYTVHIKNGVLSSTISDQLEANDIIDNATKFNLYLTDNGYGEKIQLGKFKVNSDMTFKELAQAITR